MIFSGVPPCSQSLSVRLGKPLEPRASEAWHCAQLFMYSRSPIACAWGSRDSAANGIAAKAAYTGAVAVSMAWTSAVYCPSWVQPRLPA